LKLKTRKLNAIRNFPLADAVAIKCSEKGFSLLQWEFNSNGFPRHSNQLPTEVVKQILKWRDSEINFRMIGG